MNDGYAKAIKIQFKREDECFCEIKYELKMMEHFHWMIMLDD